MSPDQLWKQAILNISQNELIYSLAVQFGVYRFALILYNICIYQWILNKLFFTNSTVLPDTGKT